MSEGYKASEESIQDEEAVPEHGWEAALKNFTDAENKGGAWNTIYGEPLDIESQP